MAVLEEQVQQRMLDGQNADRDYDETWWQTAEEELAGEGKANPEEAAADQDEVEMKEVSGEQGKDDNADERENNEVDWWQEKQAGARPSWSPRWRPRGGM